MTDLPTSLGLGRDQIFINGEMMTHGYNYAHVSGVVESSSYGELKLDADYFPTWWWSSWTSKIRTQGAGNSLNYGSLIGHEHALDIPGEWVRTSDDKLRIILPESESPETVPMRWSFI